MLRQQVLRLPPPGPDLLAAAAVAGGPARVEDLAAAPHLAEWRARG